MRYPGPGAFLMARYGSSSSSSSTGTATELLPTAAKPTAVVIKEANAELQSHYHPWMQVLYASPDNVTGIGFPSIKDIANSRKYGSIETFLHDVSGLIMYHTCLRSYQMLAVSSIHLSTPVIRTSSLFTLARKSLIREPQILQNAMNEVFVTRTVSSRGYADSLLRLAVMAVRRENGKEVNMLASEDLLVSFTTIDGNSSGGSGIYSGADEPSLVPIRNVDNQNNVISGDRLIRTFEENLRNANSSGMSALLSSTMNQEPGNRYDTQISLPTTAQILALMRCISLGSNEEIRSEIACATQKLLLEAALYRQDPIQYTLLDTSPNLMENSDAAIAMRMQANIILMKKQTNCLDRMLKVTALLRTRALEPSTIANIVESDPQLASQLAGDFVLFLKYFTEKKVTLHKLMDTSIEEFETNVRVYLHLLYVLLERGFAQALKTIPSATGIFIDLRTALAQQDNAAHLTNNAYSIDSASLYDKEHLPLLLPLQMLVNAWYLSPCNRQLAQNIESTITNSLAPTTGSTSKYPYSNTELVSYVLPVGVSNALSPVDLRSIGQIIGQVSSIVRLLTQVTVTDENVFGSDLSVQPYSTWTSTEAPRDTYLLAARVWLAVNSPLEDINLYTDRPLSSLHSAYMQDPCIQKDLVCIAGEAVVRNEIFRRSHSSSSSVSSVSDSASAFGADTTVLESGSNIATTTTTVLPSLATVDPRMWLIRDTVLVRLLRDPAAGNLAKLMVPVKPAGIELTTVHKPGAPPVVTTDNTQADTVKIAKKLRTALRDLFKDDGLSPSLLTKYSQLRDVSVTVLRARSWLLLCAMYRINCLRKVFPSRYFTTFESHTNRTVPTAAPTSTVFGLNSLLHVHPLGYKLLHLLASDATAPVAASLETIIRQVTEHFEIRDRPVVRIRTRVVWDTLDSSSSRHFENGNSIFAQVWRQAKPKNESIGRIIRALPTSGILWPFNIEITDDTGEDGSRPTGPGIGRHVMNSAVGDLFDITESEVPGEGTRCNLLRGVPAATQDGSLYCLPDIRNSSPGVLSALEFVGRLLGFAARAKEYLAFMFPPLVWKFLIGERPTSHDLTVIDPRIADIVQTLRNCDKEGVFLKEKQTFSPPILNDNDFQQYMTTRFPENPWSWIGNDGKVRDIHRYIPNRTDTMTNTMGLSITMVSNAGTKELGSSFTNTYSSASLTYADRLEYADALEAAALMQWNEHGHLSAIRRGFGNIIPLQALSDARLSWKSLEVLVCGSEEIDVGLWKQASVYGMQVSKDDPIVKLFWETLQDWSTKDEDRKYVRKALMFGTSRMRLPLSWGDIPFKLNRMSSSQSAFRSQTCNHTIYLPAVIPKDGSKAEFVKLFRGCLEHGLGNFGNM